MQGRCISLSFPICDHFMARIMPLAHPGCDREIKGKIEDPSWGAGSSIQVHDFEPAQALYGALRP